MNETQIGPWREGSPIGSPTTLVLASSLSHAAIVEGVRAGRTILKLNNASDPDIDLVAMWEGGGSARVGGSVPTGVAAITLLITVDASSAAAAAKGVVGGHIVGDGEGNSVGVGGMRRGHTRLRTRMNQLRGCVGGGGRALNDVYVSASAPTVYLALVRNNERTYKVNIPAFPFAFNVTVPPPVGGVDRWRAELHDVGSGALAVLTNHIFLFSAEAEL